MAIDTTGNQESPNISSEQLPYTNESVPANRSISIRWSSALAALLAGQLAAIVVPQ
jgi:hypothetical protein